MKAIVLLLIFYYAVYDHVNVMGEPNDTSNNTNNTSHNTNYIIYFPTHDDVDSPLYSWSNNLNITAHNTNNLPNNTNNMSNSTNNASHVTKYTYLPTFDDFDSRHMPSWYNTAKIGIFIKLELYLNKSSTTEWFWRRWNNGDKEAKVSAELVEYKNSKAFVFKASKLNPDQWAQFFHKSGARYVVIAAKNRDGFALFPSGRPTWNSVDVGPKTDIVGILSEAIQRYGLKFGVYYSISEGCNNLYLNDSAHKNTVYIDTVVLPDIKLLVNNYNPSLLWADGDDDLSCGQGPPICSYWKAPEILFWLYNDSPVKDDIVVNDRWCNGTWGIHGDFFNFNSSAKLLMLHKWEHIFKMINQDLYYRKLVDPDKVLTLDELLLKVVSTVSYGGNVLINVQSTQDGVILPIVQERLLKLGKFLKNNAEAIYDSSPWFHQKDSHNPDVWYTCGQSNAAIYVIFLKWPEKDVLIIKDVTSYIAKRNFSIDMINPVIEVIEHSTPDNINEKETFDNDIVNKTEIYIAVPYQFYNDILEVDLMSPFILINDMHAWVLKIALKDD